MNSITLLAVIIISIGLYVVHVNNSSKAGVLQRISISLVISGLFSYPFKILLTLLNVQYLLPLVSGIYGCLVMTVLLLYQNKDLPSVLSYVLSFTLLFTFGWLMLMISPVLYNTVAPYVAVPIALLPLQSGSNLWDSNRATVLNMDGSNGGNIEANPVSANRDIDLERALELERSNIQTAYHRAYAIGRRLEDNALNKGHELSDKYQRFMTQYENDITPNTRELISDALRSHYRETREIELIEPRHHHQNSKMKVNNKTYTDMMDILSRDGYLSQAALAEVSSMKNDVAYMVREWETSCQRREEYQELERRLGAATRNLEQHRRQGGSS